MAAADAPLAAEQPTPNADKVFAIRRVILEDEKRLLREWPVLKHQDAIGLAIFLASLTAIGTFVWAFAAGRSPLIVTVLVVAFSASLLHELEHDLIHQLYFRKLPAVQNIMFVGIWFSKLSLNPWARRELHLLHHRVSGSKEDVEERLIGLGQPAGVARILYAFLPLTVVAIVRGIERDSNPKWSFRQGHPLSLRRWLARVDLAFVTAPLWAPALGWWGNHAWARVFFSALVVPNLLRHGCLALVSSYAHYYGDIPPKDLFFQCQILRHWALMPLQAFCCDFGATHIIHHYVVGQAFFVRHLVRHAAWAALEAHGTRVNDFGIVARANRYFSLKSGGSL